MERPGYVLIDRRTGARCRTLLAAPNETLYDALERSGVPVRTSCRGSSICGRCWVVVERGLEDLPPPGPDEQILLDRHAPGEPRARLACRLELPKTGPRQLTVSTDYWSPP